MSRSVLSLAAVFAILSWPALAQTAQPQPGGSPAPGFQAPPRADAPAPLPSQPMIIDRSSLELQKTVKTGRDIYIGSYITIDKSCKVGTTPKVEIVQQPPTGTLRVRPHAVVLMSAPGVQRNKCLGTSPAGIAIWYRSKARFKGDDKFSYSVAYPDGRQRDVTVTMSVQ